jgi:hypothetical protein
MISRNPQQAATPDANTSIVPNIVSASAANGISYLLFHPISTIRDRIQMHPGRINTLQEMKKIIFMEAHDQSRLIQATSMYKGFVSAMTYKLLSRTMKYTMQPVIAEQIDHHAGQTAREYLGNVHGKSLVHAIAGGCIGAAEVAVLHPLNTLKSRRQAFDLRPIMTMYKANGVGIFYNGFGVAFTKSIPAAFALFGTNAGVMSYYAIENPEDASLKHHSIAASCGVVVGALVTNPQDVVMKRAQNQHTSIRSMSIFKQILNQQGIKGLYRGIILNILTSLPKKAAPLALYGFFLSSWQQYEKNIAQEEKTTNLHK